MGSPWLLAVFVRVCMLRHAWPCIGSAHDSDIHRNCRDHDPAFIISWLLQEHVIRLEACTEFMHTNLGRYSCAMAFEGGVQPWHWRKSALW